jgi:protein gp37
MGVSVGERDSLAASTTFTSADAHVKFLSLEPLLGPLAELNLRGSIGSSSVVSRALVRARLISLGDGHPRSVPPRGMAFFFKQWGGRTRRRPGEILQGRAWTRDAEGQGNSGHDR